MERFAGMVEEERRDYVWQNDAQPNEKWPRAVGRIESKTTKHTPDRCESDLYRQGMLHFRYFTNLMCDYQNNVALYCR